MTDGIRISKHVLGFGGLDEIAALLGIQPLDFQSEQGSVVIHGTKKVYNLFELVEAHISLCHRVLNAIDSRGMENETEGSSIPS